MFFLKAVSQRPTEASLQRQSEPLLLNTVFMKAEATGIPPEQIVAHQLPGEFRATASVLPAVTMATCLLKTSSQNWGTLRLWPQPQC